MTYEYGFDEQLAMSEGVAATCNVVDVLLANIPGSLGVCKAHETNDRTGTDWWIEMNTGRHLSVDAKVRSQDWSAKTNGAQDDLALEVWSVKGRKCADGSRDNTRVVGWTRDDKKRTDYVLWLWTDTRRFCLIPFPMLCAVFTDKCDQWYKKNKHSEQFTPPRHHGQHGYWSECVFVPRRDVWAEIYLRYSPTLGLAETKSKETQKGLFDTAQNVGE
jgi:hypothetical protein